MDIPQSLEALGVVTLIRDERYHVTIAHDGWRQHYRFPIALSQTPLAVHQKVSCHLVLAQNGYKVRLQPTNEMNIHDISDLVRANLRKFF